MENLFTNKIYINKYFYFPYIDLATEENNTENVLVFVQLHCILQKYKKTHSVALGPRENYTDWATATCQWNLVPTFVYRRVSRGQRGDPPRSLISVL
jgi:hypothetical protein